MLAQGAEAELARLFAELGAAETVLYVEDGLVGLYEHAELPALAVLEAFLVDGEIEASHEVASLLDVVLEACREPPAACRLS